MGGLKDYTIHGFELERDPLDASWPAFSSRPPLFATLRKIFHPCPFQARRGPSRRQRHRQSTLVSPLRQRPALERGTRPTDDVTLHHCFTIWFCPCVGVTPAPANPVRRPRKFDRTSSMASVLLLFVRIWTRTVISRARLGVRTSRQQESTP